MKRRRVWTDWAGGYHVRVGGLEEDVEGPLFGPFPGGSAGEDCAGALGER